MFPLRREDKRFFFLALVSSTKKCDEIGDRGHRKFWFATGGAGFCISRPLAEKMTHSIEVNNFKVISDCIGFPDDVTVGFIIGKSASVSPQPPVRIDGTAFRNIVHRVHAASPADRCRPVPFAFRGDESNSNERTGQSGMCHALSFSPRWTIEIIEMSLPGDRFPSVTASRTMRRGMF